MDTRIQHVEQGATAYQRQIVLLQIITVVWMCIEAAVAVFAAVRAQSVALLGFGLDSVIELASAIVVLMRFNKDSHLNERAASRIAGILLFILAVFITASSILALTSSRFQPAPSYLGIALLIAAALAMPSLARRKRALSAKTKSGSLKADAVQSSTCAYLAWIALGGLVLNAVFKLTWADPVAAMCLLPIVVREGGEALKGKAACDCAH
ncbi:MAG TPA: cation transporter [Candidatus Angelobacter sp.]